MTYGWRDLDGATRVEMCDECGFDGRRVEFLVRIPEAIRRLGELSRAPEAGVRPAAGIWSAREYSDHCLESCGEALAVITCGRPEPRVPVGSWTEAEADLSDLLRGMTAAELDRTIELGGAFPVTPRWMLSHLLHELEHHLLDVRRGYARILLSRTEGPSVNR